MCYTSWFVGFGGYAITCVDPHDNRKHEEGGLDTPSTRLRSLAKAKRTDPRE